MASLSLPPARKMMLPPPRSASVSNTSARPGTGQEAHSKKQEEKQGGSSKKSIPSYEERCSAAVALLKMSPEKRKGEKLFVPRTLADFEDGGAYPEIHVAQYPRHMGNPRIFKAMVEERTLTTESSADSTAIQTKSTSDKTEYGNRGGMALSRSIINVQVDSNGEVSYDAIVKGGTNSDKKVYSRLEDMRESKEEDVSLPTEEEEQAEAERTNTALQAILESKMAWEKPKGSAIIQAQTSQNIQEKTQFIQYTPREDAPGYNAAAAPKRVIQMVPAQVDPIMPPKHKHVKAPAGPAEDPVPVLHAPPTKLTKEERDAWNIPACISNWKNSRGYTIPLDKRLAADGRGLREHVINDNFATLSESLYEAERQARQEVRMRAQVQKKLALQEKERREEQLRELANQARRERGGAVIASTDNDERNGNFENPYAGGAVAAYVGVSSDDEESIDKVPRDHNHEDDDAVVAAQQREQLRLERKRQRERELRLEKNMEAKKKRLEEERDISEKIALGVHTGNGGAGAGEDVFDARLYNQTGGMDSGFGREDEYNTFSQPLWKSSATSSSIYRPTRGETEFTADEQLESLVDGTAKKFVPDRGFAGAEGGTMPAAPRNAPVQFEKEHK